VLCVIGVIAGIYTLRTVLYQEIGSDAQVIASILNVIQIQVLTYVYDHLAFKLTDLENRRNDVLYEDSMIIKLFLFQFVNNYSSFYYLAFIAGSLPVPNGANKDSKVRYRICIPPLYFTLLGCCVARLNND
jgi:Calcium-activated chloride channel